VAAAAILQIGQTAITPPRPPILNRLAPNLTERLIVGSWNTFCRQSSYSIKFIMVVAAILKFAFTDITWPLFTNFLCSLKINVVSPIFVLKV